MLVAIEFYGTTQQIGSDLRALHRNGVAFIGVDLENEVKCYAGSREIIQNFEFEGRDRYRQYWSTQVRARDLTLVRLIAQYLTEDLTT